MDLSIGLEEEKASHNQFTGFLDSIFAQTINAINR